MNVIKEKRKIRKADRRPTLEKVMNKVEKTVIFDIFRRIGMTR